MLRSLRALVVVCVVALLATACSASDAVDKQGYIKENNKIQKEVAADMEKLDPSKPEDLKAATTDVQSAIDKFKAMDVPADYKKSHAKMVDALEQLVSAMKDVQKAVDTKDPKALAAIQSKMSAAQAQYNDAINSMNADLA